MADDTLIELLILDDSRLRSMAADQRFLVEFPFLRNLANTGGARRKCCAAKAAAQTQHNLASIKSLIVGLSVDKRKKLLDLLGARQVRIYWSPDGKTTKPFTIYRK